MNQPIQVFDGDGLTYPFMELIACFSFVWREHPDDEGLEWFQIMGPSPASNKLIQSFVAGKCYSILIRDYGENLNSHVIKDQRLKGWQYYAAKDDMKEHWSLWFYPEGAA